MTLRQLRVQQQQQPCTAAEGGAAIIIMHPSVAQMDPTAHNSNDTPSQREERQQSIWMLRWLRTLSIDYSDVPFDQHNAFVNESLAVQQRSVLPCAVQRVVVNGLQRSSPRLQQYVVSLPVLTALDLRDCHYEFVPDQFLCAVATVHHSSLQRLNLPDYSCVSQSTLDRFTMLEELDVSHCGTIANVDFCAATLRVLYANGCRRLSDDGLKNATKLEVLHVGDCRSLTSVSPFAHCLLELDAGDCGISSAALSRCYRLQVLDVSENDKIDTLQPFAGRLRELHARGLFGKLGDAALAEATQLVKLNANNNPNVTTVAPFGSTLIALCASSGDCGITDAHLVTATNLVCLNAYRNRHIRSVTPFASTLLELNASSSMIGDAALAQATNLVWLNCSDNEQITTVAPFGPSLRHLFAYGSSSLNDLGLTTATNLVTLDCSLNTSHRLGSVGTVCKSCQQ